MIKGNARRGSARKGNVATAHVERASVRKINHRAQVVVSAKGSPLVVLSPVAVAVNVMESLVEIPVRGVARVAPRKRVRSLLAAVAAVWVVSESF